MTVQEIIDATLWVDQVSKIATRYNDAFKVFELADSHAIERMFAPAKVRHV